MQSGVQLLSVISTSLLSTKQNLMDDVTLLPSLCLLATGKATLQRPNSKPHAELKYRLIWKYSNNTPKVSAVDGDSVLIYLKYNLPPFLNTSMALLFSMYILYGYALSDF